MRKTRRMIALVLALTFMFCLMAVSFSVSAEEIQLRTACSKCGYSSLKATTSDSVDSYTESVNGCEYVTAAHIHLHEKVLITYRCPICDNILSYYRWRRSCV